METKEVIIRNRKDPKGFVMFCNELQEAIKDGWVVPTPEDMTIQDLPGFLNHFAIRVYKHEDYKSELPQESPKEITLDLLDDKSAAKEDLLALAEIHKVEVPEEKKKYPRSIAKVIRETLAKREG